MHSQNLQQLLPKWLMIGLFVCVFVGFADAALLTITHYTHADLPCSITNGCDTVTRSAYAMVGSVPLALIGALYYLSLIVLLMVARETGSRRALTAFVSIVTIAFLITMHLVYLQFAVLHAVCVYCMFSALITTVLFLLGIYVLRVTHLYGLHTGHDSGE